jgi:hypothetical protein
MLPGITAEAERIQLGTNTLRIVKRVQSESR